MFHFLIQWNIFIPSATLAALTFVFYSFDFNYLLLGSITLFSHILSQLNMCFFNVQLPDVKSLLQDGIKSPTTRTPPFPDFYWKTIPLQVEASAASWQWEHAVLHAVWLLFTFGGGAVDSAQSQLLVVQSNRKGLEEARWSRHRNVTGAVHQHLKTCRVKDDSL